VDFNACCNLQLVYHFINDLAFLQDFCQIDEALKLLDLSTLHEQLCL